MKDKISTRQIEHAAAVIIMATGLLIKSLYTYVKNDAWIAVIAGLFIGLLMVRVYAALAKKYPGCTLMEINEQVYGRIPGKLVSALYIFYFFTIACLNTNILGNFVKSYVMQNTPIPVILVLFIGLCIFAIRKGPASIMRYSTMFAIVTTVIIIVNGLLMYNIFNPKNLQPVLALPMKNYLYGTHIITMIPICDPFVFLMFLPDMLKPKEFGKALVRGVVLGSAVLLLIVLRDIMVLGATTRLFTSPSYSSIRLINIGDLLTRMDVIFISVSISLLFYKVSVFLYATVSGVSRIMEFESHRFLIYVFGALLIVYALSVFVSESEHAQWRSNGAASMFQTVFLVLLPVVTLIISSFRGQAKRTDSEYSVDIFDS
jgi:spore germination protein KB